MKSRFVFVSALYGLFLCGSTAVVAQDAPGQSVGGHVEPGAIDAVPAASNASGSSLYAAGTRAINEGRWANAEAIFAMVAGQHGDHADGALYWKAYAENKQDKRKPALATCTELSRAFPTSSWIHECGALEIEIHSKTGKPVDPTTVADDDLKLLALNSLMQKDESRALAQIQEILNTDSSEKLKQEALFILGQHYSDATYAQIVRISYVEGDVRIARGEEKEKPADAAWEKAVANLPLETGFSLVTGAGRAEIEFEDASTLYLGENSVLTFNDLHTTSGVPYTDLGLLTGTVSLNLHSYIVGDKFFLRTPTDTLSSKFPDAWNARVSSYLDGIAYTTLDDNALPLAGVAQKALVKGRTQYYRDGRLVDLAGPSLAGPSLAGSSLAGSSDPAAFADWDHWVADRVAHRTAAMAEMMKASGLTVPIPGLEDMQGQGTFFACPPYGTCWEPAAQDGQQQPGDKVSQAWPPSAQAFGQGAHVVRTSLDQTPGFNEAQATPPRLPDPLRLTTTQTYFPCFPAAIRYRMARDPVTGIDRVVDTGIVPSSAGWNWAVCHAGSWVHRRHHYCWVAGNKRHHIPPVRWVKSGNKVAVVPVHPYDVKGRPPINRKEEVFALNNKHGFSVERLKFEPGHTIEELKSPPREYRNAHLPPLSGIGAPHMEGHVMKDGLRGGNLAAVKGVPLGFDSKLQSFTMAKDVVRGSRTVTVSAPVTNRAGTLQARGGSFAGAHGGFSGNGGARAGGGFSGSGSHGGGGSSSGGGSHGGGGSSGGGSFGGGGGSHGGGGGGGSSAGSSGGGGSGGGGGSHR
jgi:hypothetical protein